MRPQRLRIFRIRDGVRIPYTLELDHELTVIAEYADATATEHVITGRRDAFPARVADSPARRIAAATARWCSKAVEENPIPGSDQLREDYFTALDALHASFVAQKRPCPPCEIGKLMRFWREKLEKGGYFSNLA